MHLQPSRFIRSWRARSASLGKVSLIAQWPSAQLRLFLSSNKARSRERMTWMGCNSGSASISAVWSASKLQTEERFKEERAMLSQTPIVPYIPVKDMVRARKFYEEKVGLKPKQEYADGVIYE